MVDLDKYIREAIMKPTTSRPNRLQLALDQEIGFENRIDSRISNIRRGYDEKTGEYIFWLEYRTRVKPGTEQKSSLTPAYPLMHEVSTSPIKP